MPSFDLVSKVDLQTLDNAINTVEKEIKTVLISREIM